MFFSEEKNQKTFMPAPVARSGIWPATWLVMIALWGGVARGETVTPPVISPPDTWVPRTEATLHVLNKLDSTVQTITLHVGETSKLQSLSITLKACDVRPPDLPADATANLAVTDSRPGQPGFEGWLLEKEPALNLLEHPVYDIQLAGCS